MTLHYTNLQRLDSYYYNKVHSHNNMYFEWGSEVCDPTEANLDDGIDVNLTSTDPRIIVVYDA